MADGGVEVVLLHGVARAGGRLLGPVALAVEEDRDPGRDERADDGPQRLEVAADLRDLPEHARPLGALVVDDGAVELLGAAAPLADLEVLHGVGAVGDGLERLHAVLAGAQEAVVVEPVGRAGAGLHHEERFAGLERAHVVVREAALRGERLGLAGALVVLRVGVPRDEVDLAGDARVVEAVVEGHEVRRDRRVRRVRTDGLGLPADEVGGDVGDEAPPVDDEAVEARVDALDLVPVRVAVRPEAGPPGVVELVERAVFLAEPVAERGHAARAAALAGVFVGEVPERERGVLPVALGERAVDSPDLLAVDGRRGAVVVPAAPEVALRRDGLRPVHAEDLGILLRHPRGAGAGGRGKDDRHAALGAAVHHVVEPAELVAALLGLERGPGEDADGDRVDPGEREEAEVLVEDAGHVAPLVGVVVAAVEEEGEPGVEGCVHGENCTAVSRPLQRASPPGSDPVRLPAGRRGGRMDGVSTHRAFP